MKRHNAEDGYKLRFYSALASQDVPHPFPNLKAARNYAKSNRGAFTRAEVTRYGQKWLYHFNNNKTK